MIKIILAIILANLILPIIFVFIQIIVKDPVYICNISNKVNNLYLQAFILGCIMDIFVMLICGIVLIIDKLLQ